MHIFQLTELVQQVAGENGAACLVYHLIVRVAVHAGRKPLGVVAHFWSVQQTKSLSQPIIQAVMANQYGEPSISVPEVACTTQKHTR